MLRRNHRDQTSFGSLDYVLMAIGNCFAVYAAGMAVGAPEAGKVFVAAVLLGTLCSLAFRKMLANSRYIGIDSFLYTFATLAAVVFNGNLNSLLPADGIPADVTTAGWLCWMISFGSFLAWRDRTLLFQAVPTIALFGLIGCYDTFAPAPFLFFGFLLCLATSLGRSHSRDMLRQAVLSGYFNRADTPHSIEEHPEQSAELYEEIKRGPWRWLAGPEWALASGMVIVALSLLGAPAIRHVVEPISGAIKVYAPRRLRNQQIQTRVASQESAYVVGRGPLPNPNATPRPQFLAELDQIRYLRTSVFDLYNGHGWSSSVPSMMAPAGVGIGSPAIDQMKNKHHYTMTLHRYTPADTVPLPAEVESVHPSSVQLNSGGSAVALDPSVTDFSIRGVESTLTPRNRSTQLPEEVLRNCLDRTGVSVNVAKFALDAAGTGKSDIEKARAICTAIAQRCKYFKGASAVPPDQDAADFFLNQSQVGYCDLFATAMVECARTIGIPAHFCIGYLPELKYSGTTGGTVVYDQDYHAWAELYFEGVGWVVFDATSGATSLDKDPAAGSGANLSSLLLNLLDFLIAAGILAGIAFFLWQNRSKSKTGRLYFERTEIKRLYLLFSRALSLAGVQRRSMTETAREFVERVAPLLEEEAGRALSLNRLIEDAMYGPVLPNEAELKRLAEEIRAFSKSVRAAQRSRRRTVTMR